MAIACIIHLAYHFFNNQCEKAQWESSSIIVNTFILTTSPLVVVHFFEMTRLMEICRDLYYKSSLNIIILFKYTSDSVNLSFRFSLDTPVVPVLCK